MGIDVIKFLLAHGANPTLPSEEGNTPLHFSTLICDCQATYHLLEASKVGIQAKNIKQETPLELLIASYKPEFNISYNTDVSDLSDLKDAYSTRNKADRNRTLSAFLLQGIDMKAVLTKTLGISEELSLDINQWLTKAEDLIKRLQARRHSKKTIELIMLGSKEDHDHFLKTYLGLQNKLPQELKDVILSYNAPEFFTTHKKQQSFFQPEEETLQTSASFRM